VKAASFTTHALRRVDDKERTGLTPEEVARILDNQLFIPIGREKKRVHKLFYSERDDDWFVAVQDEENGEVVTIMPYHYHNRWEISSDTLREARSMITGEPVVRVDKPASIPLLPKEPKFKFMARVIDGRGRLEILELCSFPRRLYPTPESLLADTVVVGIVRDAIAAKIGPTKQYDQLYIKIKKSKQIPINLPAPDEPNYLP
jgi:hypothetical protein